MPSLRTFLLYVAAGALVFGFVHSNTEAVTAWLRQAGVKLARWLVGLFRKSAPLPAPPPPISTALRPSAQVSIGSTASVPAIDPASTPSELAIIAAGQAKIAAWLKPAIDWTKVTAGELTTLYQQQLATAGVTTWLRFPDGEITTDPPNRVPSPNFQIQSFVLKGIATTESERAYVGYNDANGIGLRFAVSVAGVVTPR